MISIVICILALTGILTAAIEWASNNPLPYGCINEDTGEPYGGSPFLM